MLLLATVCYKLASTEQRTYWLYYFLPSCLTLFIAYLLTDLITNLLPYRKHARANLSPFSFPAPSATTHFLHLDFLSYLLSHRGIRTYYQGCRRCGRRFVAFVVVLLCVEGKTCSLLIDGGWGRAKRIELSSTRFWDADWLLKKKTKFEKPIGFSK